MKFVDQSALVEEASQLHRVLFGREIPTLVAERYVAAHLAGQVGGKTELDLLAVFNNGLDLEAIELATRRLDTTLNRKMLLLLYLTEVSGGYSKEFENVSPGLVRCLFMLGWNFVRSIFKAVYGGYLLRRYRLV